MSDKDRCKLILKKMKEIGYDVCPQEWVDTWTDKDISYFLANYQESYKKALEGETGFCK